MLTGPVPPLDGVRELGMCQVADNELSGPPPAAPDSLLDSDSGLCPNHLDPVPSPAWDRATGVTPWYYGCTPARPAP